VSSGRTSRRLALGLLATAGLALAGCGRADEAGAGNHGYGWSYEAASGSGLRLRYDDAVAAADRAGLAVFEAAYADVQACVGRTARGPLVVVVPRGALDDRSGAARPAGTHVGGLYYFDTDLVLVTDSLYALRHEFVHFLLDQSGFPLDLNRAHDAPAFTDCTGPTWF
jgi:hypothetical protein